MRCETVWPALEAFAGKDLPAQALGWALFGTCSVDQSQSAGLVTSRLATHALGCTRRALTSMRSFCHVPKHVRVKQHNVLRGFSQGAQTAFALVGMACHGRFGRCRRGKEAPDCITSYEAAGLPGLHHGRQPGCWSPGSRCTGPASFSKVSPCRTRPI